MILKKWGFYIYIIYIHYMYIYGHAKNTDFLQIEGNDVTHRIIQSYGA